MPEGGGVIFGVLFTREPSPRRVGDQADFTAPALRSRQRLASDYWGRYVAVLVEAEPDLVSVSRDPSGQTPCLHAVIDDVDYVFSHPGLVVDLGLLAPRVDWRQLAHHIAYRGARTLRTALVGVDELPPGDTLVLSGRGRTSAAFWRPRDFVGVDRHLGDDEAAPRLFAEVERTVAALASAEGAIVLELSGGLDSSIVALALRGRSNVHAVNVTTEGPEGDERRYARQVSATAGLPMVELGLTASDIDFEAPPRVRLARPGRSTVLQSVDAAFLREGRARGATAFFNGAGGDSVLGYFNSAAPVVDRLRVEGLGPGLATTVLDIAALTGATAWTVARLALRISLQRPAARGASPDLEHLSPAFWDLEPPARPWLEGLEQATPGRRRHVEAVLGIHGHLDGLDRSLAGRIISPHVAQPVLELALRIPTWLSVAGGRDRAVARQAYAALLPSDVFNRRSKGRINRFIAQAYQSNLPVIKRVLFNGRLAEQGVLDLEAVGRTMSGPVEMDDARFMSIVRLVDVELWARSWTG
ncbi:asparagine synthase-related protein [Caulobacter hibisci]|uniref:asparagine synthase (glutamine-hydrolyzing) n=1 Tax=Caulobacter hibisci TaxID=2035993 RepID=A0ABS0SX51_9CAUL|nr:asparagine synthase C-terminal domain-containing protein [Caulobacter hibisci]MBI1684220.1 hypothetical protein [Caulobacter hibisci]